MLRAILLFSATSAFAADHASAPFFKLLDLNADGRIVEAEVERSPWVTRLDADKDGAVNAAELAGGWDQYAALRVALAKRFPNALGYPGSKAATDSPREAARILPAAAYGVGALVPDLAFTTLGGRSVKLSEIAPGKPLVIACVSTSCPVGKRWAPTLLATQKEYAGRGVAFIFLATNKTDADAGLAAALPGALIVRDPERTALKTLGARSTTDCFVLDARRTLQYRGAVDDQYGLGYSLDAPRARFLASALDATLAGGIPAVAATEAPGCELDLADAVPARSASVTYHNRISRLVSQHCAECHRRGGVAPFALGTYDEVTEHAGMIRKMVDKRLMPPWFAAPPPAGEHSPWANDRSLPERDRADILDWLAGGKPLGDPADAPLPRTWPEGEWAIGKPDAIFQIPKPIEVKATGTMPYQTARVPTNFAETRYLSAIEVLPTARDVVHHVLVFADSGDKALPGIRRLLRREIRSDDDEAGGFFAIYVPGNNTLTYPDGFGKPLPAGATLRFQIHYTPNGTATRDQVRIGMKFTAGTPRHVVMNAGISSTRFAIPPGAANHPVEARLPIPRDAVVIAFLPHMHLRGKAWRYEVTMPGGKTQMLLDVPRYDFNWQLLYKYADPLRLPGGSTIKATGWFDNSPANPANPDPTKTVRWGPQTTDEMMLGYVEYYIPGSGRGGD
jgi:AhpC/TSA family/Copper type II ascorbate-dependent monooxygenase, C-terminal domain